jgi:hypothetical protein
MRPLSIKLIQLLVAVRTLVQTRVRVPARARTLVRVPARARTLVRVPAQQMSFKIPPLFVPQFLRTRTKEIYIVFNKNQAGITFA